MLTILLALATALTAVASAKVARSAIDRYLQQHPATTRVLFKILRRKVETDHDCEDLVSTAILIAIQRERTGRGRRWVEGGPISPLVHLLWIARMVLRMSWKKGGLQTVPLDEPEQWESDEPNYEKMAIAADEEQERGEFLRELRASFEGETNGHIPQGMLDYAAIRSHEELAGLLKCEPREVKNARERLLLRADQLREQREGAAS